MERALVLWLMQLDDHDPAPYLRELMRRPAWMEDAACRDSPKDLFFPTRGESAQPAKAICEGCPVRAECLEYSLVDNIEGGQVIGVWGGTSDRQRRQLRKERTRPERVLACVVEGCGRTVLHCDRCVACYKYRERHGRDRPLEMVLAQNEREAAARPRSS